MIYKNDDYRAVVACENARLYSSFEDDFPFSDEFYYEYFQEQDL